MSLSLPARVACALLVLPAAGLLAAAPSPQEIAQAVGQLGSGNFQQRKKATARLWEMGKAAEPALQKALLSPDPEIARRARDILEKFKYGIYPDTPPKVVQLVGRYRSGAEDAKYAVIKELAKQGTPGHAVLIKLAALEENKIIRRQLFQQLAGEVVPGLLADGRLDEVEQLLDMGLKDGEDQAIRNYAAFLALTGRLDDRLGVWTARARKLTGFQAAEVLMYLYRARGDLAEARRAAQRTDKRWLLASILFEQGDWKALAENADVPLESATPLQQLSFLAAYRRLAGNKEGFQKTVSEIQGLGKLPGDEKPAAIALLLNNRPREAIDLLVKSSKERSFAFDLLCAQHRYREAFLLAAKPKEIEDPARGLQLRNRFGLDLALAQAHALLGDREKAIQILHKRITGIFADKRLAGIYGNSMVLNAIEIIKTEVQLGFLEEAFADSRPVFPGAEQHEAVASLLKELYPEGADRAEVWWRFFRKKYPREDIPGVVKRLRQIMDKKLPVKEFIPLSRELEKDAGETPQQSKELPNPGARRGNWLRALGETCLAYDLPNQAQDYLEKAGTVEALTRLGDMLADKKRWPAAADAYQQAWKKDRNQAAPFYLYGWALEQTGRKDEARKAMDLAHLIPLANDRARFQLSKGLAEHGFKEAVRREQEFLLRTGRFRYAEVSNSLRMLGLDAYAKGDFQKAADYQERTQLECLGYVYFVRPSAYLTVPAGVHHIRARALIAQGNIPEAMAEVKLALAGVPGDLEMAINVVPALEKKNRRKEADEVFQLVFDNLEKVCRDYPKSAQMHNSLAWLAVCCRREMDKALIHSQKAVELAPKSPGYLDTLAEIYYQRGDKARAFELMKKCAAMEPKSEYYLKQLKRFAIAGPPSETPR